MVPWPQGPGGNTPPTCPWGKGGVWWGGWMCAAHNAPAVSPQSPRQEEQRRLHHAF